MKKTTFITFILLLLLSLTACDNNDKDTLADSSSTSSIAVETLADENAEETTTEENTVKTPKDEKAVEKKTEIPILAIYSDEENNIMNDADWIQFEEIYLTTLREKYKLEELVADCDTELDKIIKVTEWVSGLWEHDGYNTPKQGDPIYILDQVTENGERYRCVEYGVVINGCLQALGITSRTIRLGSADVDTRVDGAAHAATEAFLSDYEKWVFIDGQFGVIPMLGDTPLNLVELGEAIANKDENLTFEKLLYPYLEDDFYCSWIEEYIYYLEVTVLKDGTAQMVMLMPNGADEPTKFQREKDLTTYIYTNSKLDFYPKVK